MLLCVFGWALPVAAQQQPAGRVTITLGVVEAESAAGDIRSLMRGDPVFEGDTLRTGPAGRAQVRFTDRGVLSLRPGTELAIDEYGYDAAAPATSSQTLNLSRGGFRTQTGGIASANRAAYRVQTPVASIGIRGTTFDAHQEAGGPLLVGASQGGVEVVSSTGIVARIGVGESFNFLRVNPDGSIDFLLETPDAFAASPEVDEGEDDEETDALDAGDSDRASMVTGGGSAESTAGTDSAAGANLIADLSDPDASGSIAPAQTGSGEPPTVDPIDPGAPVAALSPAQIEALLADDRVGLAIGVQGASIGEDGSLQPTESGLFGGIATFNSPLLALSSGRSGLGDGITGSDRADLLDEADIFLLADSATFTLEQNVGGVPGLIWGRYASPVSVFVDAADASRILQLDRDILFLLGTPTNVADMQGLFFYEVALWDAISSGLPVSEIFASGSLDLGSGLFAGFLDILLGESSESGLSLFAEFQSQVSGGVLQGIEFGSLDLFDFANEQVVDAEGTLAGFFTGDAAAFLQLAFDFRVPSRTDADVSGLVLLERQLLDAPDGALTPEEAAALDSGLVFVAALCCFDAEEQASGAFGGVASDPLPSGGNDTLLGVNLLADGDAAEALDPEFLQFPPDAVIRRSGAPTVAPEDLGDGLFAFEWQGQVDPVLAFDAVTGDPLGIFDQSLQVLVGVPTPTANLVGTGRFELDSFRAFFLDAAGLLESPAVRGAEMSFNVAFANGLVSDGIFLAEMDLDLSGELIGLDLFSEATGPLLFAFFEGQVGLANGNAFVEFELLDGGIDFDESFDPLDIEASVLTGFFTGAGGNRFASAFRFQTLGENFLDEGLDPILLVGTAVLGRRDLSLSEAEAALFGNGLAFVGIECCRRPGAATGLATMAGGDAVLGIFFDENGESLSPLHPAFGASLPQALIRRAGAFTVFDEPENLFDLFSASDADIIEVFWSGEFSVPLVTGTASGLILERLGDDVLFYTAQPSSLAALTGQGFTTFSGAEGGAGFRAPSSGFGFTDTDNSTFTFGVTASFNVDLASGDVFAGHLFVIDEFVDESDGEFLRVEELGFEVFFDGAVAVANGNSFAEMRLLDGSYRGLPLDLEESEILGFFTGESGVVFLGSYGLQTRPEFGPVQSAAGIFGLSNVIDPELRLSVADVSGWTRTGSDLTVRPSFGLAAFDPLFTPNAPGGGLLLGRGNQVIEGEAFVLGANALKPEFSSDIFNSRRSDFFAQPFEFVLRRADAEELSSAFNPDARPSGMESFANAAFHVSWGAWGDGGEGQFARIQPFAGNPTFEIEVGETVFFASVTPTPISGIPRTGSFRYEGGPLFAGSLDAAFNGSGGGSFSGVLSPVDSGSSSVGFDLDFVTGNISAGLIEVFYLGNSGEQFRWNGGFEGFLNGAVTDLQLIPGQLGLTRIVGGIETSPLGGAFSGNLTGLLTGPGAERHAGGFAFQYEGLSDFESVHGLWVIDALDQTGFDD